MTWKLVMVERFIEIWVSKEIGNSFYGAHEKD